jgi:gliding motility-associated-like protein
MRLTYYIKKHSVPNIFFILSILLLKNSSLFSQTPPTAQFTGSQDICVNTPGTFTNQSIQGTSPIVSYTWDFGDGNSSTSTNPAHTYSAPGTYTVTLVAQAANGQADSEVKVNYIVVRPKPQTEFSVSTNGCSLPVGVTFNNSTTGAISYSWNFGNGQTSTQQNPPTVNYTSPGNYTVRLIATNGFGCKDTITQPIVVSNFQAGINASSSVCEGTPVTISDNSTVGANSWNWSFPGATPNSSTVSSNSVTYNTPGTYTISLSSQNTGLGCSASTTKTITVLPKPTPSFTNTPTTGCSPLTVNFNNTGQQAGASYTWNFGNGNTSTLANPTTIYNGNGSYDVTLTMTGANGCSNTITIPSAVTLSSPIANFTSNVVDGCADLDVQFTSTSTSPDPITNWIWQFGDGTTYTGQAPPVHTYGIGVYDVTLIIQTQNGCIDTIIMSEYIKVGEIDLVNFSLHESPQCAKRNIQFTNSSVISVPHTPDEVTYYWDFGDGGNSTAEHPSYSYASDTGYFDVSLVVNFRGCMDTLIIPNAVYIKAPISKFSPNNSLICNPASLPVTINVNDDAIIGKTTDDCTMIWKWGDGTQTTLSNTQLDNAGNGSSSHQYFDYGTYTIEQVIHNYTTGCSDSSTQVVYVSQTIADITLANDSICVGNSFQLSQNSTSTHALGTYLWNMGNSVFMSGANPTYAYPTHGTYTITLTATNNVGCSGSTTFTPFTALALPQANIIPDNNAGCAPFFVTFSNGSTPVNNGVSLQSFVFSFQDDGSTQSTSSIATPITHTFNTEGNFYVNLVATDRFGCVSAPASTLITITKPTANFSIPPVACGNEQVTTTNNSSGENPVSYQWFVNNNPVVNGTNYTTQYPGVSGTSSTQYSYTLIATDGNGCKDTSASVLVVSTPIADADYALSGASVNSAGQYTCPPVFSSFTNTSDSYGTITNYSWNFGDGKQSTLQNPNNTYVFPGTYSFSLKITDEFGCSDSTIYIDYLTIFGPEATPSWTQSSNQCGQLVTFELTNMNYVSDILWGLGDGTTMNDSVSFTHQYVGYGSFIPTVTVFDNNNCQVSYPMDTIHITNMGLDAYFSVNPSEADLGQEIVLNDLSSSTGTTIEHWSWYAEAYGNFHNTSGIPVSIGYGIPGYYEITLVIQDNNGCSDSYKQTVHVTGDFTMPNVFTPNGDGANDYFSLAYDIFESYDFLVLNRWGNVIIEGKGMTGTNLWDGKTKGGSSSPEGVYFYKFYGTLKDGTTTFSKDGFITLVR